MSEKIEIIPSVVTEFIDEIKERVALVKGLSPGFGVGIVDGIFADNLSVAVDDLEEVDWSGLAPEVQLMVEYPSEYLGVCRSVGIKRVLGQIERMGRQSEFVEIAHELGILPGLALDVFTPVEEVDRKILDRVEGIIVMATRAGADEGEFDGRSLKKIGELRNRGYKGYIQVNGGIDPEAVRLCKEAGADRVGVDRYLWDSKDVEKAMGELALNF